MSILSRVSINHDLITSLNRFFTIFCFISIFLFCTISNNVYANSKKNIELQVRTISVAPYGIYTNEQNGGIYFELADQLIAKTDYRGDNQIAPYARIMEELKTGDIDLTIMFRYPELERYVTFITPLPTLKNVVIGLKGSSFKVINDLKGKSIAYLRGAKFSDIIDKDRQIIKYETTNFLQGIKMLKRGRVDAIIGPLDPIMSAAFSSGNSAVLGEPLVVSERTPWLQISNKSKVVSSAKTFARHFNEILKQGELEKLRKKYLTKIIH